MVRAAGFQALSKVSVRANGAAIAAVLNVVDDAAIFAPCDLGLSEDASARLDVPECHVGEISHAEPPASFTSLHRKIVGERLARDEWIALIDDVAQARYSKMELAVSVVAIWLGGVARQVPGARRQRGCATSGAAMPCRTPRPWCR